MPAFVDYTTTSLGGNLWRFDYTINNSTPNIDFDELSIYFDVDSFTLLDSLVAPAGWHVLALQPDAGIQADGVYDALNLGGFVASGASLSGFSVVVTYRGTGVPEAPTFELIDSTQFSVVWSGSTSPVPGGAIPEPSTALLVLLPLWAIRQRVARGFSVPGR